MTTPQEPIEPEPAGDLSPELEAIAQDALRRQGQIVYGTCAMSGTGA